MRLPALVLAASLILGRHPLHTTHTDLREGPGGRVSVTIRSFRDDLHAALARQNGVADDSALARYVRGTVRLIDQRRAPVTWTWDSVRSEGDIVLLSFHAVGLGALTGARLVQEMQMELYPDQVNVVQLDGPQGRTTLLFTRGDGPKALR
jgi:hypothetical protein